MNKIVKSASRALFGILLGGLFLRAFGATPGDLPLNSSATNPPVPRRGGTLRLALPTDVSSLDPALAFDTISGPFLLMLYEGLVEYGDGLNVVPCLAKDWNISEDHRIYTFHLRPGVRFSNGRELVASDVVYSLERLLDPKTAAPSESWFEGIDGAKDFRAGKAAHIRGLRLPRSDTLEIELEHPDPSFLYVLTVAGALVVPREEVERLGKSFTSHPVGTGPYRLTQWRRGVEMRFERNPYSTRTNRQYLDAVQVMVGGDTALHLMMFERGELDIADTSLTPGIPVQDFIRISHSPRWRGLIDRLPGGVTWFLYLNTEMAPFDNLQVRRAMNYAIDKQKLARLMHGTIMPANSILPPMMPGFNTNLTGYPFDPAKARQLLAAAGHPDGFTCKLWCDTDHPTVGASVQYDLAQVGIDAQLNLVAFAPMLDSLARRKTAQSSIMGWSQDYPDPSDFLDGLFNGNRITDEGCQNYSFYNSPRVNQLLTEAAACPDPERRLRIYQAAEQAIMDDAPCVCLFHDYLYALRQPWLHEVRLHPVVYYRFERMWLDDTR
jgi:oligopeptide transport system substrate-binding protein